jgi:tetratricopeptide (TPR) repeat protein
LTGTAIAPEEGTAVLSDGLLQAMLRLTGYAERARFIVEHPELIRSEVVSSLAERVPRLIRADLKAAAAAADFALLLARRIKSGDSMALAFRAKANVLHVSGENRAAVRHHERARELFAEARNRSQVARTLSGSIQPLILLGEYERAHAAAAEASTIFREEGNAWRLARVELNTGNIFDRQDRFSEALACYRRAHHELWQHRAEDPEAVAVVLHNMAGCFVCLNDFQQAVETYEKARTFAAQNTMPVLVAQADYNIAWLHYLRGEYSRAISQLRTTRDSCAGTGDDHHCALCHLDLSEIYLELNMAGEAAEAAEAAQGTFHRLSMRYEEGKAAANRAIALSQQEKLDTALEQFSYARTLFVHEKNSVWCSLLDLYLAVALYKQGQDMEAKRLARAALRFFTTAQDRGKTILCHLLLSRLAMRASSASLASRHCSRALACLETLDSPAFSCQIHAMMAQAQQSLGRTKQAYEHFQHARNSLEELRSGIHADELKISFMRDRVKIYEGLVDLCLTGSDEHLREAFTYIEQAKSRSLFDLLLSERKSVHESGSEAIRIRQLRQELNWYQHRLEIEQLGPRAQASPQIETLRTESRKRERELLRLSRENASLAVDDSSSSIAGYLPLEKVQEALDADSTIIEYFQVRDRLLVLLISRTQFEVLPIGAISGSEVLLSKLRFQMAKLRLGADYVAAFGNVLFEATLEHLRKLYDELIAPVRASLQTSHLIVIPHGPLHHLPFHALHDRHSYLIDEFTVSYAPSAGIYAHCSALKPSIGGRSLVMAIPDPAIPLVEEEARAVAAVLPNAELVVGVDATHALLQERAEHARFLHIATHGYFREDQPMFSGIRLADSCLSLFDLYQLRLPVELVTLSGCSTGLNVVSAGDEILGLERGLMLAGAQSALLTLWDVHDQSTAEFMTVFYRKLEHGLTKARAFQEAMLELRKSHQHPYYWAPFVLIGKVSPG